MSTALRPTGAFPTRPRRLPDVRARLTTAAVAACAAIGVLAFHEPPADLTPAPFDALFGAVPAPDAFGRSGALRMHFAMPGDSLRVPLAVHGDPARLAYRWLKVDAVDVDSARPLLAGALVAPASPGYYQLAVEQEGVRRLVPEVTLAVLVPFEAKQGAKLDGYRIGTYVAERLAGREAHLPDGFVRVDEATAALPVSKHFRVGDFLSHDGQRQWPRYAALSPRLVDKLELVLAEVARAHGAPDTVTLQVRVNAGFRSPSYNRTVARAAKDSRHQYGDAADVAVDANFDGRFTREDSRLVAAAVERVEREHPELVGGMGLYLGRQYAHGYVHIDARGRRARWRG